MARVREYGVQYRRQSETSMRRTQLAFGRFAGGEGISTYSIPREVGEPLRVKVRRQHELARGVGVKCVDEVVEVDLADGGVVGEWCLFDQDGSRELGAVYGEDGRDGREQENDGGGGVGCG
jgi:hypothetical protein